MPRRERSIVGAMVYHVLNRAVGRQTLFEQAEDYQAFERVILEALLFEPLRILAYCVMPNHWHSAPAKRLPTPFLPASPNPACARKYFLIHIDTQAGALSAVRSPVCGFGSVDLWNFPSCLRAFVPALVTPPPRSFRVRPWPTAEGRPTPRRRGRAGRGPGISRRATGWRRWRQWAGR